MGLCQQYSTASTVAGKSGLVQHYGYHTCGAMGHLYYNKEWASLAYFVFSQETAFEQTMLANFDHELLIGQISYRRPKSMPFMAMNVSRNSAHPSNYW